MISVIIIGYNIEKYIIRCIESIVNQTYNNFEIIFVDDGSTDSTYSLLEKYKNKNKITNLFLYKKNNEGCVKARLYGLSKAKGEYVTFIDGDDYIYIDSLKWMKDVAAEFDTDIITFCEDTETKKGKIIDENCIDKYLSYTMNGNAFLVKLLINDLPHHIYARLFKKKFLQMVNFESLPAICNADDFVILAAIAFQKPNVKFSKKSVYRYCYNYDSITKKNNFEKFDDYIKCLYYIDMKLSNIKHDNYISLHNVIWLNFFKYMFKEKMLPIYKKREYIDIVSKNIGELNFSTYFKESLYNTYIKAIYNVSLNATKINLFFIFIIYKIFNKLFFRRYI